MKMSRTEKLIRKWVRDNFGQSEVDEPSWNIKLLAEYIDSKNEKIYYKLHYVRDHESNDHLQDVIDEIIEELN